MKTLRIWLPLFLLATALWFAFGQQKPPELLRQANGEVTLTTAATAGAFYRIEASPDMKEWQPLVTVKSAGSDQLVDTASPAQPQRFYRAVALEGTDVFTGDHLPTTNGDAVLRAIGHASVVVAWNGKAIYSDPSGAANLFAGLPKANVAVVTHTHGDHFSTSILASILAEDGIIFAPQSVFIGMTAALKAKTKVLANGASDSAHGAEILAVPMYNLSSSNHPKGVGNGYVVTLGGKRLYFSGDTEDIPEMRALTGIDAAFVCMSLPSNMTVDAAASAVREFKPKLVFPYHYRQGSTTFETARFKQLVGQASEVRLRKFY